MQIRIHREQHAKLICFNSLKDGEAFLDPSGSVCIKNSFECYILFGDVSHQSVTVRESKAGFCIESCKMVEPVEIESIDIKIVRGS